jgi:hypothetical protein
VVQCRIISHLIKKKHCRFTMSGVHFFFALYLSVRVLFGEQRNKRALA